MGSGPSKKKQEERAAEEKWKRAIVLLRSRDEEFKKLVIEIIDRLFEVSAVTCTFLRNPNENRSERIKAFKFQYTIPGDHGSVLHDMERKEWSCVTRDLWNRFRTLENNSTSDEMTLTLTLEDLVLWDGLPYSVFTRVLRMGMGYVDRKLIDRYRHDGWLEEVRRIAKEDLNEDLANETELIYFYNKFMYGFPIITNEQRIEIVTHVENKYQEYKQRKQEEKEFMEQELKLWRERKNVVKQD